MGFRGRRSGALGLAAVAALTLAAPASADHHLVRITEVHPASATDPAEEAVELQLLFSGENRVTGKASLELYGPDGTQPPTVIPLAPDPPNGEIQRTMLAGTPTAPGAPHDFPLQAVDALDPNGGTVCLTSTVRGPIDCVRLGTVSPPTPTPSPVGTAAPAILPAGQSLQRNLNRFCPDFLDFFDDTSNSAIDFFVGPQTLRNNLTPPPDVRCAFVDDEGDGGGEGDDSKPPDTTITKKPQKRSAKKRVRFEFKSSEKGSQFACKLDRKPYRPCSSPYRKKVGVGRHKFKVRAIDDAGNADPTPAKAKFRRVRSKAGRS